MGDEESFSLFFIFPKRTRPIVLTGALFGFSAEPKLKLAGVPRVVAPISAGALA